MSKYTETQVSRDAGLRRLAEEYALRYDGEFQPVLSAQRALQQGRELTVSVAKVVLNIARTDPRVSHLLPIPADPFVGFGLTATRPRALAAPRPDPVIVRPATPRGAFLWSEDVSHDDSYRAAGLPVRHTFHLVGRMEVRWHRNLGGHVTGRMACGLRPTTGKAWAIGSRPPDAWEWCRSCWRRVVSAAPTTIDYWTCDFRDECPLPAGHPGSHERTK